MDHKLLLLLAIVCFSIIGCRRNNSTDPPRPTNVAKAASFVGGSDGGVWLLSQNQNLTKTIEALIQNEVTGEVEYDGLLKLCKLCEDLVEENMPLPTATAFDGTNLYLDLEYRGRYCFYSPAQ